MSGVDERVETVRAGFRSFGHPIKEEWPYEGATEMVMVDGCASPETCDMCAAEAALSVLAAELQAAEQRAEEARPIETLDESALRTIQAQAARVAALETVVAGLEQRADDAEQTVSTLCGLAEDGVPGLRDRAEAAEQRADEAEARLRQIAEASETFLKVDERDGALRDNAAWATVAKARSEMFLAAAWLPGADFDDVKQEALIALWEAARCYDPSKGPFPRFAATVIHRRLKDAVKASNRLKHKVLTDASRDVSEELVG